MFSIIKLKSRGKVGVRSRSMRRITHVLFFLLCALSVLSSSAQKQDKRSSDPRYYFDQYVFVSAKNGDQVPARICSVHSKKKYYVKAIDSNRAGIAKAKDIRPMTEEEIQEFRKKKGPSDGR